MSVCVKTTYLARVGVDEGLQVDRQREGERERKRDATYCDIILLVVVLITQSKFAHQHIYEGDVKSFQPNREDGNPRQ